MMKKCRVRSKGLLGEGYLETVVNWEPGMKVGDPVFTIFSETGEAHVACTIVEIFDDVLVTTPTS